MSISVERQRGLEHIEPYTPGKPIEDVKREYGLTDIVKLASNENPLGPSPRAIAALQAAVSQMNLYPDPEAYALRSKLAAQLGLGMDHVRVGNGADGLIREACLAFLQDDDETIASASSFPNYYSNTVIMRARLIKVPLRDFRLDLPSLARAITGRTKIIFVCNPNNPTGTIVSATEVASFMDLMPDHVLVVFDEAYFEFVDSPCYPDTLRYVREGRRNVLVLRTFSKVFGIAGIRIGYGIAHPELMSGLRAVGESFPVNRLAQIAGEAALEDRAFLEQTVEMNRAGRRYLYEEFERLGLDYLPSETNFIMVNVGDSKAVFQKLLPRGIIIRPGVGYELPQFARITIGTRPQNERLIQGLEAVLVSSGVPALG